MPQPTEVSLLTHLLLPPASLPTILTLQKFTALFPISLRSSPQIPLLYHELQHQRALQIDAVRKNVAAEAKRGESMKREVIRTRRREEREGPGLGVDVEEDRGIEGLLADTNGSGKSHTLASILPELDAACSDLEAEIAELEDEAGRVLSEMQRTVGQLSDLRYGKFAVSVREEVLEGLKDLRATSSGFSGSS
ncbi:hypothetical protein MMC17_004872 [Xylographa soralifera]|nr:hypothetical protein [Xylographa soralifera]